MPVLRSEGFPNEGLCEGVGPVGEGNLCNWGCARTGCNISRQSTQEGPGSVRFGYGSGVERFERFRFSVPAAPLQQRLSLFQYSLTGKDGSGSGCGSRKTVPAVPVPLSVSGKTVPTVPVPGSGSVPEPP